jgi:hypothetical protein
MQWVQAGFSQMEGRSAKTTTPMQSIQVPPQEAPYGHKQENEDQSRSFNARAGGAYVPTKLQMRNISNQLVQLASRLVNHTSKDGTCLCAANAWRHGIMSSCTSG